MEYFFLELGYTCTRCNRDSARRLVCGGKLERCRTREHMELPKVKSELLLIPESCI